MFDIKSLTGNTARENLPLIGAVKVNKTFKFTDRSYECAAWWEEREAQIGTYPVFMARQYHSPNHLYIVANIAAKVTDDYFPGLWGGVAISNEPYKPKHVGEARIIHKQVEVEEAIQDTGISPGNDLDWFIHPSWWEVFAQEAQQQLQEAYEGIDHFWEKWASLDKKAWKPEPYQADLRWKFDDEYRSRVGMVAHFGGEIEKWARRLEKINWHASYHNRDSDYQRENFAKNTEWAKAIFIRVNQ